MTFTAQIDCMLAKKILILSFGFLLSLSLYAQIIGTVVGADKNPLNGITVQQKNSKVGTKTNVDGLFTIKTTTDKPTLIVTGVGYETLEYEVTKKDNIVITLKENITGLNDVVVVGYGTQKRKDVTGSVVSVGKDRLENLPNNSFAQALQGSVPGVSITTGSSEAEGNGTSILVRGRGSIKAATSPLFIVDGIPYEGGVSELNPNDIESIDVLKDASSVAIYGSRGANGVILITTKQGKKGKMIVKYEGSYGIQHILNKPNLLNGAAFYQFKTERVVSAVGSPILYGDIYLKPSEKDVYQSGKWANWYDLATQSGIRNQHSVSLSGGVDKTKFYFGATYLDVHGIAKNDVFKRYSLRSNIEHKITNWLTLTSNTQLSVQRRDGLAADFSGQNGAVFMNPLTTPYNADGSPTIYAYPENQTAGNPLSNLLVKNEDNSYRMLTSNAIKIDIPYIKGLSYKLNTGVELENTIRRTYYGKNTATGYELQGKAINYNTINRNFTIENILYYTTDIGKHSINFTGLYSLQSKDFDKDSYTGTGFPSDVLTNYQMSKATLLTQSAAYYKQNLLSQMARINYSYDSRYMLTLTVRRDGFTGFAVDSKYGLFPSAALAWNIFREKFMDKYKWLSNLKLRASYGINGNQAVASYASLANFINRTYISTINNVETPLDGVIISQLQNQKLGWESKKALNIGFDIGILKNRITATVDFYHAINYRLLLDRQISPVTGISGQSITENIGKTENTGVELLINSTNIKNKILEWSSSANISFNKNKILELYPYGGDDITNKWFIGKPINVNYSYVFNGIFQKGEDVSMQPGSLPGFVKIKDVNPDKIITKDDRTIIGQTDPKYTWGISNTLKFKRFTVYIFIQGAGGNTKENPLAQDGVFTEITRNTTKKNWWTENNPTNEHWANNANANSYLGGVNIYEDASYIRVKDITISFDLSAKGSGKNNKFYVSGRNLATITNYKGIDPELATSNSNTTTSQWGVPLQREFTVGISLTL